MAESQQKYRLDKGLPVFIDIDKTLLKGDTGKEWLTAAGITDKENFQDLMEQYQEDGLGHSNELLNFLSQNPDKLKQLHEKTDVVHLEEREGIGEILDYRKQENVPNIGASAGYQPVIRSATNGNLHDVIAGELTESHEPVFNGQNEKRQNVEKYLENLVDQTKFYAEPDLSYTSIGDSNGDLEKIRGADESGGYGIAIGETLEEAQNRVDEATFYVGDGEEHYLTGALLNELTLEEEYRMSPEMFAEKYGSIKFEPGKVETGELADQEDIEEINRIMNRLETYD